jgi:hypothetical protein
MKMTAHIHFVKYAFQKEGEFQLFSHKLDDAEFRTYVCSQEIEIDVPADYDPRAQQIAALEKQKQEAMADFQKSVDDINERISKLQALEYTA